MRREKGEDVEKGWEGKWDRVTEWKEEDKRKRSGVREKRMKEWWKEWKKGGEKKRLMERDGYGLGIVKKEERGNCEGKYEVEEMKWKWDTVQENEEEKRNEGKGDDWRMV